MKSRPKLYVLPRHGKLSDVVTCMVAVSGGLLVVATVCGTRARVSASPLATVRASAVSSKGITSPVTLKSAGFPNASNTGVPASLHLTPYTGPSTITTCGTVIDSRLISGGISLRAGNGTHSAATPCLTIKKSLITGVVDSGFSSQGYGPLVLTDDEVNPGNVATNSAAIIESNYYLERVNVHGGGHGAIQCDGYCQIRDSWTHDFFFVAKTHYDGFETSGNGGRPVLIQHNTINCNFVNPQAEDGIGGCSANVGLFGDFAPVARFTITNNLFHSSGSSYCLDAGSTPGKPFPRASKMIISGNVFQRGSNRKCADYGPVAFWTSGDGNVWSGNLWDDGTQLLP